MCIAVIYLYSWFYVSFSLNSALTYSYYELQEQKNMLSFAEIIPGLQNWTTMVQVLDKQKPLLSKAGNRYQKLILIDEQVIQILNFMSCSLLLNFDIDIKTTMTILRGQQLKQWFINQTLSSSEIISNFTSDTFSAMLELSTHHQSIPLIQISAHGT